MRSKTSSLGQNWRNSQSLPNRQYLVKMDGSGRISRCNRKFLCLINPVCSDIYRTPRILNPVTEGPSTSPPILENIPAFQSSAGNAPTLSYNDTRTNELPSTIEITPNAPESTLQPPIDIRRSTRNRVPRKMFQANLKGKSHDSNCPS